MINNRYLPSFYFMVGLHALFCYVDSVMDHEQHDRMESSYVMFGALGADC